MKTKFDLNKTVFLIDGSSFLYRAFYSLPPMHTKSGEPVQVVYGFCRLLKKIFNRFNPAYCGIVWDSYSATAPTVRHELYKQYKEQRQSSPSELNMQRDLVKEFVSIIGLRQVERPGIEADDILYSLSQDFAASGINTVLITSDKDMRQCVSDLILIFDPFKDEILDKATIELRYSIPIEKLIFYFALIGDSSDNIPGARGIGPKTAQELISSFASVEDLYKNLDKIKKPRTLELLRESQDNVLISEKLFSLYYYSFGLPYSEFAFQAAQWNNAAEFFRRLDFISLLKDLPDSQKKTENPEQEPAVFKKLDADLIAITNLENLNNLVKEIQEYHLCAIDTETTGLNPLESNLVGISICTHIGKAYYIPVGHKTNQEQLDIKIVTNVLKSVLEDKSIKKYLHNAKFDQLVLSKAGIELDGLVFDTLIAAHLVTRDWQRINLKWISEFYLQQSMLSYNSVVTKAGLKDFSEVPIDHATEYAAADAHQTLALYQILEKELDAHGQKELFLNIEMPLINILYKMEKEGILVDSQVLDISSALVVKEIKILEQKIQALIPEPYAQTINLNSPRQLGELLFNTLKLPVIKKTSGKTSYSTDQSVLDELGKLHPVPALISSYRELFKIKSTYIDALQTCINPNTKRIHTSFSQTSTATGRLSSSEPNLQNIPTSKIDSIAIRRAFKAPSNSILLSADYSQFELRVLAYLSQDKNLLDAFINNLDIHTQTASGLFGLIPELIKPEQRAFAKLINFSILYGLSAYGLSKELSISFKEAKIYIERYFEQYPGVISWMNNVVEKAKETGYTQTLYGRRRYVPGIQDKNRTVFEAARRIVINTPVQGTQAELMKIGMINLDKALISQGLSTKLILQIHDELILSVPNNELDIVSDLVSKTLEQVANWNVPLIVSIRTGINWQEITK